MPSNNKERNLKLILDAKQELERLKSEFSSEIGLHNHGNINKEKHSLR